jgi:hypothetical protein
VESLSLKVEFPDIDHSLANKWRRASGLWFLHYGIDARARRY